MKNLRLLLAFAAAYGFGVNFAYAETQIDRFRTNDGAQCEQSYNTGREFEMGVEANEGYGQLEDDVRVFAKWTWELGRDKVDRKRISCLNMIHLEEHRMQMANERQALELELLRMQVEAAKEAKNNPQISETSTVVADGDDW